MRVLLITGAGASRNLGIEGPMPLMPDWADALCMALDGREANLAASCHLNPGMSGPEFETNLGLLLRWQQVRDLEKRFQDLGGPQAGSHFGQVEQAREHMNRRMALVMETLNVTLFEQFGQGRVDDDRATSAFRALLETLDHPELIFATTNYDRAGETALSMLGYDIDTGFRQRPNRTPTLEPEELIGKGESSKTPAIHLHGAVGWYEREGKVGDHHADQPYNPSLGIPVVLYPDPEKDPTNDAIVSQLWAEFRKASDIADVILVIGHSLHDPALLRVLKDAASKKPVVISILDPKNSKRVTSLVPEAVPLQMNFGPEIETDTRLLELALEGKRPASLQLS